MRIRLTITLLALTLTASAHSAPTGVITGMHKGHGYRYRLADGALTPLPPAVNIAVAQSPDQFGSVSANGRWIAYSTSTQVLLKNKAAGVDKVLFDIKHPASLLSQLARAPKGSDLKDFADSAIPDLTGDPSNWAISDALISRDAKSVYFLTNAGAGLGASGNTTFCVVRADVDTGKATVLTKLGTIEGEAPDVLALSPDDERLLIACADHNSAADNSYHVLVDNIATGKSVDLLAPDPSSKSNANVVRGACWSPDGRYVAVSVWYYNAGTITHDTFQPKPNLEIKDASTGWTLETVADFADPAWRK